MLQQTVKLNLNIQPSYPPPPPTFSIIFSLQKPQFPLPQSPPESMSPTAAILLLFLFLSLLSAASATDQPSVYEVLQSYNFPAGLLPEGVTNYTLDRATGKFTVSLGSSCSFSISGYDLKYQSTISGEITPGKISDLKGIQVKILFFWINIIEVSIDGNELAFSVGIASANFPVDNFSECPQCGCGFDCVNSEKRSGGLGFVGRALPLLQYN